MSTRALVLVALLLALLLGATAYATAANLGLLETWEDEGWTFENPTLLVERGDRCVVRPMVEGAEWERCIFTATIGEPARLDQPLFTLPYVALGVQSLRPGDDIWRASPNPVRYLALAQLGALTHREWLQQIQPVRERTRDGSEKIRLRAAFGHESGQTVVYFHDPDVTIPGIGWIRQERHSPEGGREPEVFHAARIAPLELAKR